jgi:hypothetical protein
MTRTRRQQVKAAAQAARSGKLLRRIVRTIARDRRLAAIHEAGHLVVARSLGVTGYAYIQPLRESAAWQRMWIGRFSFGKSTKQQRRLIAVAGAVAEGCWLNRIHNIEDVDWYEPEVMSESDWGLSGCPVGEPNKAFFTAVDQVATLLRCDGGRLWSDLVQTSRDLIDPERPLIDLFAEAAA